MVGLCFVLELFMRTKHVCVLIHIVTKGEVGTVKHVHGW